MVTRAARSYPRTGAGCCISRTRPAKQRFTSQPFEYGQGISIANYDVLPDGRFVMLRAEPGGVPFHVSRHWADGLKGK